MNKAIFLDRDGVINKERKAYNFKLEHFILNEEIFELIKQIREQGYLIIVITNQSGIAQKLYTKKDVDNLHDYFIAELSKRNLSIDAIYYCPHHYSVEKCFCRKPESIMIEKAIARFNVDVEKSVLIGDSERDIQAAKKAGLKGFQIESNKLQQAFDWLKKNNYL